MTAEGLARLEDELRHLKSNERPAVIRAIAEARTHGDLSENAEYHAARERQSFIEGRVAELEAIIAAAEVIDISKLSGNQVMFGARVTLVDEETEEERTWQIVGAHEADIKKGLISISSPVARAILGKKVGDVVEVPAPGGAKSYEITAVGFGCTSAAPWRSRMMTSSRPRHGSPTGWPARRPCRRMPSPRVSALPRSR
jgi:transcription elongation factor GreA